MTETAEDPFNRFWKLYPRRMGKRAAQLKFRKACERADIFDIMKGLKEAVVRFKTIDPKFIPYPATWLHQDRWLDEADPAEDAIEDPHPKLAQICDTINDMYRRSQEKKGNPNKVEEITKGKLVVDEWLKRNPLLDGWARIVIITKMLKAMDRGTKVSSFAHWEQNHLK